MNFDDWANDTILALKQERDGLQAIIQELKATVKILREEISYLKADRDGVQQQWLTKYNENIKLREEIQQLKNVIAEWG